MLHEWRRRSLRYVPVVPKWRQRLTVSNCMGLIWFRALPWRSFIAVIMCHPVLGERGMAVKIFEGKMKQIFLGAPVTFVQVGVCMSVFVSRPVNFGRDFSRSN